MLGFFKSKIEDVQAVAAKFANKETAEAIVAVMTGVAFADGELEEAERKKLVAAFTGHPTLKLFPTNVLNAKFTELSGQFGLDTDIGLDACLKEVKDVAARATEENRTVIMRLGVMAAKADGEIEPAEAAFLRRVCDVLGLRSADFGL